MPEIIRTVREMDELVQMQDRAIKALQTGIEALADALNVIKCMIIERGQQKSFLNLDVPPLLKLDSVPYYKFGPTSFPGVNHVGGESVNY